MSPTFLEKEVLPSKPSTYFPIELEFDLNFIGCSFLA